MRRDPFVFTLGTVSRKTRIRSFRLRYFLKYPT